MMQPWVPHRAQNEEGQGMITKLPQQGAGMVVVCLGIFHLEKYSNRDLWNIHLEK